MSALRPGMRSGPSHYERELIKNGVPPSEASLVARAIRLGQYSDRSVRLEVYALRSIRRSIQGGRGDRGRAFRKFQQKVVDELLKVPAEQIAFGDVPDAVREQNSAFYYTMFQGNQARFIDRNEDETPEEYLDRPGKATMNVTRLAIKIMSKLYQKSPSREIPAGSVPDHVAERLEEIWGSQSWNLSMLDADAYTRLCGTIAIRPMYDPDTKGKIKLWLFMSHQLRVIPDPEKPWRPKAVIERVQPFGTNKRMTIWTDESFVAVGDGEVTYVEHGLGRIPHVICRDERSYTSFFVEGRGRLLAEPNAVLNNNLTALEEVKAMQGFATMQLVNPVEDEFRVGPRQVFIFRPKTTDDPHGVEFKKPDAPIKDLRDDCSEQVRRIFLSNNIPMAAVGAEIEKRALSGEAIKSAMQPILDDLEERTKIFTPIELELADSCLRMVKRHEPTFEYDPEIMKPSFKVTYQMPGFPLSTRDKVLRDEHDLATSKETPAGQMFRDDPDSYPSYDDALAKWQANLEETRTAGFDAAGMDDSAPSPSSSAESLLDERADRIPAEPPPGLEEEDVLSMFAEAGLLEVTKE